LKLNELVLGYIQALNIIGLHQIGTAQEFNNIQQSYKGRGML